MRTLTMAIMIAFAAVACESPLAQIEERRAMRQTMAKRNPPRAASESEFMLGNSLRRGNAGAPSIFLIEFTRRIIRFQNLKRRAERRNHVLEN